MQLTMHEKFESHEYKHTDRTFFHNPASSPGDNSLFPYKDIFFPSSSSSMAKLFSALVDGGFTTQRQTALPRGDVNFRPQQRRRAVLWRHHSTAVPQRLVLMLYYVLKVFISIFY